MGIKRQSINFPDIRFEDERLNRVMQAMRSMAAELQALQQMLRSGSTGQVLEKTTGKDYDAGWVDSGAGHVTGAQNLGPGAGLFADLSGTVLQFKTLIQGENIEFSVSADTITISATPTGGGTGTVTSVGIASADLDVTGTPVTDSGTITLAIKANAVTYHKMQETVSDGVVLGRKLGDGPGDLEELGGVDLLTIIGVAGGYPKQLAYSGIV